MTLFHQGIYGLVTNYSSSSEYSPVSVFCWGLVLVIWGLFWFKRGEFYLFSRLRLKSVRLEGYEAKIFAQLCFSVGFLLIIVSIFLFAINPSG